MKVAHVTRLAIIAAMLPVLSCSEKSTAPEPAFRLVSVDDDPLPVVITVMSTFEQGTVYTSVLSSRIELLSDNTFTQAVTLRDSSSTQGRLPSRQIDVTGTYAIANDSLSFCWDCGGDVSISWKVPYTSSGFTLPLLFSTGEFRAYKYEWR